MPKFKIIQESPYQFKTQLLNFWEEYLPGTPSARLDWMESNPAGSAVWLFAIEEKTGKLTGVISLFPKDLFFDGKRIKAAIVGDFMLHKKFRVFGPALSLLKATIAFKEEGKFDFLYTIPNLKSKKIIEKAGFRSAGKLYSMMCPQRSEFFLEKYVGSFAAGIMDRPLIMLRKLISLDTYIRCNGVFEEIDWHEKAFNLFCKKLSKSRMGMMTGDCQLSYLDWRYRKNPELDFQVFTFREQAGSDIQGFFVFTLVEHRLELYDIVALNDRTVLAMIKKINIIAKIEKCQGIYCLIYEDNPLLPVLKRCCFFDTKYRAEIYMYPEEINEIEDWYFTSADRNI